MEIIDYNQNLAKFTNKLDNVTQSKVTQMINLLEDYAYTLRMPYSKSIDTTNLFELRIRGKQEIRIFYCFYENKIILLHYFIKKSQRTPLNEVKLAKKLRDGLKYNL